jgi:hypothetical protein
LTLAGVPTVLRHARLVWKRARASIRGPDPDYDAKLADVEAAAVAAQAQPGRIITVSLDEGTVERQPTVANAYAPTGTSEQARAVRGSKSNPITRIVEASNALTGDVFHRRASKITVGFLVVFYQALCRAYPDAERISGIQENWPVPTHPDLLVALEPQETRWPGYPSPELAHGTQPRRPPPLGGIAVTDPNGPPAHRCLVVQSHQEALAQAAPGRDAPPSLGG